jgi:Ca2+-binding RTX toxin-like protein
MNRKSPIRRALAALIVIVAIAAPTSSSAQQGDGVLRPSGGPISGIWANDGGRKVVADEIRSETVSNVRNSTWNGSAVTLNAARNETVAFNLILEATDQAAGGVSVDFDRLQGPGGYAITGNGTGDGTVGDGELFDYTSRDIEVFYIRYLQIRGIARSLSYDVYEESHIPEMLRMPPGGTSWSDRPYADSYFPDIAVPIELHPTFDIALDQNQSIWVDVYVPDDAPAGRFTGSVTVEAGGTTTQVPVTLDVHDFTLPDDNSSKTALVVSYPDIARRYTGTRYPGFGGTDDLRVRDVLDEHYKMAHRHRITLVGGDGNGNAFWLFNDRPADYMLPFLDGSAFTAANDYRGPGEGMANDYYWIGLYGGWRNWPGGITEQNVRTRTDAWENWFTANAPGIERSLYLIDEPPPSQYAQLEQWAGWVENNPGPGGDLDTFATILFTDAQANTPSLDISASWIALAETDKAITAINQLRSAGKGVWLYNGIRPASGSFATEDDGVSLRELPWGQYKLGVDRWFFWQGTYYDDFQGGRGEIDLFNVAQTFGGATTFHPSHGQRGWNASNGDGVLFYPGSDAIYTNESYGLDGPLASLRLKHWRRGIQDVEYLELARAIDPARVDALVESMVPQVLWEVDVANENDPTYTYEPISWSTDPDDWAAAKAELVDIITGAETTCGGLSVTVDLSDGDTPTAGNDVILGTGAADNINGLGGNDTICAGGGDDVVVGGDGNDRILGGPGDDVLAGNAGADALDGGPGRDRVFGGSGDDTVNGGGGSDFALGGSSGVDTVFGGDGNDVLTGGSDNDAIVSGGNGDDAVNGGSGDDGDVRGDGGNDTVSGNGGDDVVRGSAGNDQVRGGAGNDSVFGDGGDDFVAGNAGTDTCDGGPQVIADVAASNCEITVNVP